MSSNLTLKPTFKCKLLVNLCFLASIAPNVIFAEEAYWHYTFKKNDNLISVAKKHFVDENHWVAVQKLNHIRNPYAIPVGFAIKAPLSIVKLQPASATLILMQGDVKLAKHGAESTVFSPAKPMAKLSLGDAVKTGERSLAVIQFVDGSLLNLQSSSSLVLDSLQAYSASRQAKTLVKLKQGQLQVNANPEHIDGQQLQVSTPNAIAAVRGTVFRVSADEHAQATTQETLTGRVGLSNAMSNVEVNQGYGTAAVAGKPPLPPVPLLPALDTSHMSKTWQQLPVQFQFPLQPGATAWHVKVLNAQAKIEDDLLVSEPRFESKALPDGQYQLLVTALDQNKIEGYEAKHAFKVALLPSAPALLAPEQGAVVRQPSLVMRWQQTGTAKQYMLELAKDANFAHLVAKQVLDDKQFKLTLPKPAKYYWRLAGIAKNKQGPYSPTQSFDFKPLPQAPNLQDFKIITIGNRLSVTYIGQHALHSLHLQLKHPQFPDVAESHATVSADTLNLKTPTVLELREYGKQQLLLTWQEDSEGFSDATAFHFNATNPYVQ